MHEVDYLDAYYLDRSGDDDLRDYAEEAYNRDYCDYHGTMHAPGESCEPDPEDLDLY